MAFFDRLNRMAKTIGDMTNDALDSTRNAARLSSDRKAADEQFRIIGEYYYNIYINGGEVAAEVAEACETARTHMEAIAAAEEEARLRREEEERARREEELAARRESHAGGSVCPECGAENRVGTKFCCECGCRLPVEAPAERRCPDCGAEIEPGKRFCGECGCRMDE